MVATTLQPIQLTYILTVFHLSRLFKSRNTGHCYISTVISHHKLWTSSMFEKLSQVLNCAALLSLKNSLKLAMYPSQNVKHWYQSFTEARSRDHSEYLLKTIKIFENRSFKGNANATSSRTLILGSPGERFRHRRTK